jgi:hypothetical protein
VVNLFSGIMVENRKETKEKQLRENIFLATTEAAEKLMEDKSGFISLGKKKDLFLTNEKMKLEILRPCVIQRFNRDEISAVIRSSLDRHFFGRYSLRVCRVG